MPITDFASLKEAVQKWTARHDNTFSNQIEGFIALAEDRIYNGAGAIGSPTYTAPLRTRVMEVETTITVTNGVGTIPDDCLAIRKVHPTSSRVGLEQLTPERLAVRDASPSQSDPCFYTVEGSSLKINGSHSGDVTLLYYQRPPAITSDNTENDVLTKHPMVYLEATLFYAFTFIRDMEMATGHLDLYRSAVDGANDTATSVRRSGAQTRIRPRVVIP